MEKILCLISDGPQGLFEYLKTASSISDYEVGAILALDYSVLNDPEPYFKVLKKFIVEKQEMRGFFYRKLAKSYLHYIRREKSQVIKSNFYLAFELLTCFSTYFQDYSLSDKSNIEDLLISIYKDLKIHFKDSKDLIKIIRIGKQFTNIFFEVADDVITIEEIDNLLNIFESDDFVQGSLILHSLCVKVLPKRTQFLYDFALVTLIYLVDHKASAMHFDQICNFLINNAKYLNKDKRKIVCFTFKNYCNRVLALDDQNSYELRQKTIFSLNPAEQNENEKKSNQKNPIKEQTTEKTPQYPQSTNPNPNPKPQNPQHPTSKAKNSQAKPGPHAQNPLSNPANPGPNPKKPANNVNQPPQAKGQVKASPVPSSPVAQQISDIISEAEYLFINKERIEILEYFEKFTSLDYQGNPSILFHKLDELMAKDKPSKEKSTFWSIMLKVFDKLPIIDNYQMMALRDKLQGLKGRVRDNKEKVSGCIKRKEEYKEKLRNEGKFVPGFKNGDREQKRSQKTIPKNLMNETCYEEFLVYSSTLGEEIYKFIEDNAQKQEDLVALNKAIKAINALIKEKSRTVAAKAVGSAVIGTYVKGSPVDLLITEKNGNGQVAVEVIKECFGDLWEIRENVLVYQDLKISEFTFHLHLCNQLQVEVASLIKKYCLIDNRVTRLIMFAKLWVKNVSNKIQNSETNPVNNEGAKKDLNSIIKQEIISGFHISLLCICFLQTVQPYIIPCLQLDNHEAKNALGFDVWFNSEYSGAGSNLWTFGEVIYHFFNFFTNQGKLVFNVKEGKTHEIAVESNEGFIAVHPFMESHLIKCEVKNVVLLRESFDLVLNRLNKFENLQTIMN